MNDSRTEEENRKELEAYVDGRRKAESMGSRTENSSPCSICAERAEFVGRLMKAVNTLLDEADHPPDNLRNALNELKNVVESETKSLADLPVREIIPIIESQSIADVVEVDAPEFVETLSKILKIEMESGFEPPKESP